MDERPIGVFDSGVGGLTVLHECLVTLPHEDFVYLGDGARLPYGPRPLDEIRRFAREIARYLEAQGVKLDRRRVQLGHVGSAARPAAELAVPVVGVLAPEAHAAVQATRNRRIGLLATQATVASGRYEELVRSLDAGAARRRRRVPAARAADRGRRPVRRGDGRGGARVRGAAEAAGVDTVILGCTHYPLIRPILQRVFGRDVTLVFSAEETAREVAETLARKRIENDPAREGAYRFLTTGDPEAFRAMGSRFLQLPIAEVERVELAALARRPREPRRRAARRTSCGRSTCSRTSSSSRTVRALGAGEHRRALHGDARGGRAALAAGQGPRLADGRVLAAARLDGRADPARGLARQAGRPHGRDPAADRPRAARGAATSRRSASGRSGSTATCSRPTAARAARRSPARTSPPTARSTASGSRKALPGSVAAVSVGVVDGAPLLDLDYSEDSRAETDMNVVMTGDGRLVEVQATAERDPFSRERLDALLDLAAGGIERARGRAARGGGASRRA